MIKPKIGPLIILSSLVLISVAFILPLASTTSGSISVQRVSVDKYVAMLTGGEPNTQYNLQFTYLAVNMGWEYGGVFVTNSAGSLTTFEIALPSTEYLVTFRFADATTGIATYNTVTIDPANPPPLDLPVTDDNAAPVGTYVMFLGFGTAAIGTVVTAVEMKKLKLPH